MTNTIKHFEIKKTPVEQLSGRVLYIRTLSGEGVKIVSATDVKSGEMFVLQEVITPHRTPIAESE